ncbi:hypothetical protein ACFL6I_22690 [candidate division KSB1 bacterium]
MANQDIVNFIRESSEKGFSHKEIRQNLISTGWSAKDVDDALSEFKRKKEQKSPEGAGPPLGTEGTKPGGSHKIFRIVVIALLIVLVLMTLPFMVYIGVLSPSKTLPDKCITPAGFVCLDFYLGPSSISLTLGNDLGKDITILSLTSPDCEATIENAPLKSGLPDSFVLTKCKNGNIGSRYDGDITMTYTSAGPEFARVATISIFSTINNPE